MALKKPVRTMRGLAALPVKLPVTPRVRYILAAFILVLFWTIGPHTGFRHETDDDLETLGPASTVDGLQTIPSTNSRMKSKDVARIPTPSDQELSYADAEAFCFHYHLDPYNSSAPVGDATYAQPEPAQRRIYDLLLITPTTSASMLQLHLASMYPYVEYFIMLEAPSVDKKKQSATSRQKPLSGAPTESPSFLDKIWQTQLAAYHPKIIRHRLSEHSEDFKDGLDHETTTRNALSTRVIPLLTGAQRVEPGDILLVSDVEELVRPVTMKVLRNCHVPQRTTIRTRRYWYSFQYMKVGGTAAPSAKDLLRNMLPLQPDAAKKKVSAGSEWWPHPQATVYTGADTVLPDDLRKQRDQDQYVFGDGGWTCYLCDNTITETLAKLDKAGVIWTEGPRWKAAGRVVDRVMHGVDLIERTNLSRIESNPDLPPYLQANKDIFHWLVDRDGPGAAFVDFNAADVDAYRAKRAAVDAEPDFERTINADPPLNLQATAQAGDEDWSSEAPPAGGDWRSEGAGGGGGGEGLAGISEEDRRVLEELTGKTGDLTAEEIGIVSRIAGLGPGGSG